MKSLTPFLMFNPSENGLAEAAMDFYCSVFEDSRIVKIDRYGPGEQGPEGTVRVAEFELGGNRLMAIDSPAAHAFGFTPAISFWIDCASTDEVERLAAALGEGGNALMPVGNYGFSELFAWIADRYGVTWQLNFAS